MNEIPDIDIRIRAAVLGTEGQAELLDELTNFFEITGIEIPTRDPPLWEAAIRLVQNPKVFNDADVCEDLNLSDEEKETLRRMLSLDPEPQKSEHHRRPGLAFLRSDYYTRWRHLPRPFWKILLICILAGATQGWSESVINAAQQFSSIAFRVFVEDTALQGDIGVSYRGQPELFGLINSAPYLSSIGCIWLTPWLNQKLGRRGTIFYSSIFSIASPILQMFSRSWWELFLARLVMGVGIGPKSATVPIYIAEVAPASIRGSCIMFWQISTAFGIFLGSLTGVALQNVGNAGDKDSCPLNNPARLLSQACSLNWRLMLASPALPAIFISLYVYGCHESPRWLVAKAHRLRDNRRPNTAKVHYQQAYKALEDISRHRFLAARDILYQYYSLLHEAKELADRQDEHPTSSWLTHKLSELFGSYSRQESKRENRRRNRRRNRRAITASSLCMFAQQFCGVNLIVYYSNYAFARLNHPPTIILNGRTLTVTQQSLSSNRQVLFYTMGFGLTNYVFSSLAFFMVDTIGRRTLLLCTFPLLALFHGMTAIAFKFDNNTGSILALTGMICFGIFYSLGEGPVPFVYAAESMPLYCRELAMALVVSINWLFNWLLAFTGPLMFKSMTPAGTFGFYCVCCIILEILILFFVPETRLLKLEEVGYVFTETSASKLCKHAIHTVLWKVGYIKDRPDPLYPDVEEVIQGATDPDSEQIRGRSTTGKTSSADIEAIPLRRLTTLANNTRQSLVSERTAMETSPGQRTDDDEISEVDRSSTV